MPEAAQPALTAATIAMGLSAGLYFAFDVSVLPGLARGDDQAYLTAMNHINEAIENGLFGLVFLGAFLATGAAGGRLQRTGRRAAARWTWAALALYTAAVALTFRVNVPLNRRLAAASGPSANAGELAALRQAFTSRWVPSNAVRTLACTAALACLGRALASSRT
ncbi:anthrone oxygenase family protein [Streptomyces sp. NPDC049837]|uniref:anthrone oxygenase family protein n=1 Tax=Streptomyces sp. NPDC049837 TaxID=3155277 RepID=UPI00342CA2DE